MKVILKRDEFNELKKEYEVHHIEQDKYGNKKIYLNQHRWVSPSLIEKFIVGENMNISIYELLGKMKDYEAPNKIIYDNKIWVYNGNDYEDENGWTLFDEYVITDILNDEVQILETTITYKQDDITTLDEFKQLSDKDKQEVLNIIRFKNELDKKINKIDINRNEHTGTGYFIRPAFAEQDILEVNEVESEIIFKINKIIDKLNGK